MRDSNLALLTLAAGVTVVLGIVWALRPPPPPPVVPEPEPEPRDCPAEIAALDEAVDAAQAALDRAVQTRDWRRRVERTTVLSTPEPPPPQVQRPGRHPCGGKASRLSRHLATLRAETDYADAEAEAVRKALSGLPAGPFPAAIGDRYSAVSAAVVVASASSTGLAHLSTDCSEYPCLILLGAPLQSSDGDVLDALSSRIGSALETRGWRPDEIAIAPSYRDDVAVVTLLLTDPSQALDETRADQRIAALDQNHWFDRAAAAPPVSLD